MNTGIDPNDNKFDNDISVDTRLQQLQSDRDNIIIDNSKQIPPSQNTSVRQDNQNQQNQHNQHNQQNQHNQHNQHNKSVILQPPVKTSIRSINRDDDITNLNSSNDDLYAMVNQHINVDQQYQQNKPINANQQYQQNKPINADQQYQQNKPINADQQYQQNKPIKTVQQNQQYDEQQSQYQLLQQLINQQKSFQDEIIKLKENISNQTNQSNQMIHMDSDMIQQFQEKNSELEQYKQINNKLQDRIMELQNQIQSPNIDYSESKDPKIVQLKKVKEDTMEQIHKLKNVQEDIASKLNINKELEQKIKKIIGDNLTKFENTEEIVYVNSQHMQLNFPLKTITSIEFKDFDLSFDKYNITSNNNKMNFNIYKSIDESVNNNDSDTINAIDSDMESFIDINTNQNNIELSIIMGNYSIENLCKMVNQSLAKYDIKMSCNKNTNFVQFKSTNNFDLIINQNSLFPNLGFFKQNESKYNGSNKYTASKAYDFKIDKCMNIYMTNINESKPVMQYMTSNSNSQTKKIVFTPVISELDHIDFKFVDSKNKEFKFDSDSGLDFSFQLVIKYIGTNTHTVVNELIDVSSDDILNIIKDSVMTNNK